MKNKTKKIGLLSLTSLCLFLSSCSTYYSLGNVELSYSDNEDIVEGYNSNLYYRNDLELEGADPTVIYITEGEYKGYFMMYLAKSEAVNVYKSKDLTSWEAVSVCFNPPVGAWGVSDLWAPSCIFDPTDNKYYLFYSATNSNQADGYVKTKYVGMAYSDSPVGPFKTFIGTNQNGTKMDEGTPLFDIELLKPSDANYKYYKKGSSHIDAFPFIDPVTGDKYLYMSRTRNVHPSNVIAGVKMIDWMTPDYSTYVELTEVNKTTVGGSEYTERFEGAGSENQINEAPNMIYHDGKYYLTFSVCATSDPEYSVMQAIADSPLGPFTKVQESNGGVVLGVEMDEYGSQAWDHVLCTGSHSFVNDGDEMWVVYHQDKNRKSEGYTGIGQFERGIAIDRVSFVENDLGQTILHCNGPTTSIQPKVTSSLEYKNLINKAKITVNNSSDSKLINDGLIKLRSSDHVEEFESNKDIIITLEFDKYIIAKSLLIYNSSDYYSAFREIENISFSFRKKLEGKPCVGKAVINNCEYDFGAYSNEGRPYATSTLYMRPAAPMIFEFDELETNKVTIKIKCPKGQEKVAINEIVLLGKEI
jgi:GH43 family beta-xylosidase